MDVIDPNVVPRPVFVLADRHDALDKPWQAERRAQFVHVSEGVLTVRTDTGLWVVPPHHAVWLLPGALHRATSLNPVVTHTLYADTEVVPVPAENCVVSVEPLVDELLLAAAQFGADYRPDSPESRLIDVIVDRLPLLAHAALSLQYPRDRRILRIADALIAHPAQSGVLDELAADAGVTARTAARLFVKETGLTFGQWRQQLRLLVALERLGAGTSVTRVALDVGYNDVSSFIAVFKDSLGETPARYFR
ncbi:AraC family transcriptional regulator [Paraburkholderia rhizosphaerae]|uniref:AraC-like DNA-binding protein n=1 Tax=Paraburkholderia rhizosphaerae TaxID=480658 RepID=A0A4R8M357_9BURK|nr:helix-turn-helix transcriptional regulator [Paraburkholderia rhizosphaerae]TDY54225.1 AraC-like DNA-binding protein [Paraburkholderia rhizosphaerae]